MEQSKKEFVLDCEIASCNDVPAGLQKPCERCNTILDVSFAADPYQADVNNDPTPVWMCSKCRDESADEI